MAGPLRVVRLALPLAMTTARRNALRRGLLGGSRMWQIVGVALLAQKFLRRYGGKAPEVVSVEQLKRGEGVQITALDPRARRRR